MTQALTGMPPARAILALLLAVVTLGACGGTTTDTASTASASPTGSVSASPSQTLSGTVTMLAAASLTESFNTLATDFMAAHPGVKIDISYGSSSTLAQQVAQGADADLFASAGTKALNQLPEQAKARPTVTIAQNVLEIATPPNNPRNVTGLASLADPGTNVVLCAPTVPCGAAADTILGKAGVTANVVSREVDVKATLAKVALGEADAAIVYHSDVVTSQGKVKGVEIPPEQNTTLAYPLVLLTDNAAAKAFADFIAGAEGQKVLTKAGFLTP